MFINDIIFNSIFNIIIITFITILKSYIIDLNVLIDCSLPPKFLSILLIAIEKGLIFSSILINFLTVILIKWKKSIVPWNKFSLRLKLELIIFSLIKFYAVITHLIEKLIKVLSLNNENLFFNFVIGCCTILLIYFSSSSFFKLPKSKTKLSKEWGNGLTYKINNIFFWYSCMNIDSNHFITF